MKRKFLLTMGIVFLLFLQYSSANAQTSTDIIRLQKLIKQVTPSIQIEKWTIQVREKFQLSESEMKDQINSKYNGIHWVENDKSIRGTLKVTSNNFNYEFILIPMNKGEQKETLVIGNFIGSNEKTLKSKFLENSITSTCFTNKAKIFSCLKGCIDGTMEKDLTYIVDNFLETFHAEAIENASDEGFISLSAKSHFFNGNLANQMNVQVAVRRLNNQTILTVGTPIITEEY